MVSWLMVYPVLVPLFASPILQFLPIKIVRIMVQHPPIVIIFLTVEPISELLCTLLSESRSVAESFCDIAVTVKLYCNWDGVKTFSNGPSMTTNCDKRHLAALFS